MLRVALFLALRAAKEDFQGDNIPAQQEARQRQEALSRLPSFPVSLSTHESIPMQRKGAKYASVPPPFLNEELSWGAGAKEAASEPLLAVIPSDLASCYGA